MTITDNPPFVTEADIDVAAEIRDEDEAYEDRDDDDRRRENKWNPYSWEN